MPLCAAARALGRHRGSSPVKRWFVFAAIGLSCLAAASVFIAIVGATRCRASNDDDLGVAIATLKTIGLPERSKVVSRYAVPACRDSDGVANTGVDFNSPTSTPDLFAYFRRSLVASGWDFAEQLSPPQTELDGELYLEQRRSGVDLRIRILSIKGDVTHQLNRRNHERFDFEIEVQGPSRCEGGSC